MQTSTARASGFAPFGSVASDVDGEFRAFSDLRFVGLDVEAAEGAVGVLEEPLGSPFEPELAVDMMM